MRKLEETVLSSEPVYLGGSEPLILLDSGGPKTIFGEVLPPVASTPSLIFRRSTVSWGTRIFTHVKPQPRSVWTLVQPERTRASALHRARKAAAALGLPPPKNLEDLCQPPYAGVPELKEYRWRDPLTGRSCGGADPALQKKKRRKPKPGRVLR